MTLVSVTPGQVRAGHRRSSPDGGRGLTAYPSVVRRTVLLVTAVAVVALGVGFAIAQHSNSKSASSATATTVGTAPSRSIAPTTVARDTATCNGVTFPWGLPNGLIPQPTCATLGKPLRLSGVQVTASNLRVTANATAGFNNVCLDAVLVNRSGQSVSYDPSSWSLDNVSPQGAFHKILNSATSGALGHGQLVHGGSASGTVCFLTAASVYPGHLLVNFEVPVASDFRYVIWVAATPT